MTVRAAIIGAGVVGGRRAASAARQGTLTVVSDIDESRAARLAAMYGCRHTSDWEEAVAAPDVDVVAVCTSNKFLAPIAIASLEAGKHVLCEKPMGRNASEAAEIAAAARTSRRVFKVGFTLRFHPGVRHAHEICARGELGSIYYAEAVYGHGGRRGYEKEWRGDVELAGGGELLDQGVHLLDLSRWFLGQVDVVAAIAPRWYWDVAPLEDNAFVLLRGPSGEVANLHTSWTIWKNRFSFEIAGRDGYARIDGLGGSYGPETLTIGLRQADGGVPEETVISYDQNDVSWQADWADLIAAIEDGREPEVGADQGVAVMQLVDEVYLRAKELNLSAAAPLKP